MKISARRIPKPEVAKKMQNPGAYQGRQLELHTFLFDVEAASIRKRAAEMMVQPVFTSILRLGSCHRRR